MAGSVKNRIPQLLAEMGMTKKELAMKAQMTEAAISHYVKGDRVPRGVNLIKIARALGTTTDDLLGHDQLSDNGDDFEVIKMLIARKAEVMTADEKMKLIRILSDGN